MKKISLIFAAILFLFASCSNDVDYGEQYKKELYIVGSNQTLTYAYHLISKASPGKISVYCTGSELPGEDIHVSYKQDKEKLAQFNKNEYGDATGNYFQMIPEDKITFASNEVVVEKGKEYGLLHFTINTQDLDVTKLYVVPITLTDAHGYGISETLNSILYVVSVINQYQGTYKSAYLQENPDGTEANGTVVKVVKAMTSTQLLLPLANYSNKDNDLDFSTQYYLLNVNADNTLTIKPYLQSIIEQNPDERSYYDAEKGEFHIFYIMKDNYGQPVYFKEVLTYY